MIVPLIILIQTGASAPTSKRSSNPGQSPDSADSVRGVIAERVHRIEALLGSVGSPTRDHSPPKNLWFYKVQMITFEADVHRIEPKKSIDPC